jgi:hypothetical protein
MTLLTLIGNREVASKELPDFEGLPFAERVKLERNHSEKRDGLS